MTLLARDAGPVIENGLRKGGSFFVKTETERRFISHDPVLDSPEIKLPWPFSMFQPFSVGLSVLPRRVGERNGELSHEDAVAMVQSRRRFSGEDIHKAVKLFLQDLNPDQEIVELPR